MILSDSKKELGQFFTSDMVAEFMAKWVLLNSPNNILDPATGPGIFIEKVEKINKDIDKTICEVDPMMIKIFLNKKFANTKIIDSDYLQYFFENKFDAIICNPPYNRFQNFKNRKQIIKLFNEKFGFSINGYSNQYVYFLLKSMMELNEKGRCAYIVPYEFLNSGYGEYVKKILLEFKMLDSILVFDNNLNLFDDALTTSCIILLENIPHKKVKFYKLKSLTELETIFDSVNFREFDYDSLDYKQKWINYFNEDSKPEYKNLIKLNLVAKAKRGIATGNNDFFILNVSKKNKYNLSDSVCVPCVTHSNDLKKPILDDVYVQQLIEEDKKIFIFDGTKALKKEDFDYIAYGELNKINEGYLLTKRKPWYSIESKEPAPILLSVFNRGRIKAIRNLTLIRNLTTFHGLYFDGDFICEDDINIYFCYLLTPIAFEVLSMNKRQYGSGLDKFEPNDYNNAYIIDLNVITDNDKKEILKFYSCIIENKNLDDIINSLNDIFIKYIF